MVCPLHCYGYWMILTLFPIYFLLFNVSEYVRCLSKEWLSFFTSSYKLFSWGSMTTSYLISLKSVLSLCYPRLCNHWRIAPCCGDLTTWHSSQMWNCVGILILSIWKVYLIGSITSNYRDVCAQVCNFFDSCWEAIICECEFVFSRKELVAYYEKIARVHVYTSVSELLFVDNIKNL